MKRRRSIPHTLEENIAAEMVKLEAQLAKLEPGPQMDALRRKIRDLDSVGSMNDFLRPPRPPSPE